MFHRYKKQTDFLKRMNNIFHKQSHTLEHKVVTANKQLKEQLEENLEKNWNEHSQTLNQKLSQLQSSVHKHDMAIEDLLDSWEERQSEETHIRNQFREFEQNEQHLLALFDAYQEQFWNLKRFANAKDEAWSAQISLMEENLERSRRLCGIAMINECGTAVDYDLHEVIEVTDTADPTKDKRVAVVYRCGYLYKGTVIKKAQVAAYRTEHSVVSSQPVPDCHQETPSTSNQ